MPRACDDQVVRIGQTRAEVPESAAERVSAGYAEVTSRTRRRWLQTQAHVQ